MYLEISNKGTVSRKYYELIGASNKRERYNDNSVIGNKGSGAKIAPVALLRLGLEVSISSIDSSGEYILNYITQNADLGDRMEKQIVFDYGNSQCASQLTLKAFKDWDSPVGDDPMKIFKALREYIVNAWDEDKNFAFTTTEKVHQANAGETSVFITLTSEVEEILENLDKYFKFLTKTNPLHAATTLCYGFPGGNIYYKSEEGITRLFSQGVLVDCKKSDYYSSIFDYSLNNKDLLSEERVIKDFSSFIDGIADLLMSITDILMIITLFNAFKENPRIEMQAIERVINPPSHIVDLFKTAWFSCYGIKAIISAENTQIDEDAANKGYEVIRGLPSEFKKFLKKCGITNAKDVVAIKKEQEKEPRFEIVKLNTEQKKHFDEAYTLFLNYFPEAAKFSVHFFRPLHWSLKDCLGHSGEGEKQHQQIWIAESCLQSVREILKVLIHEGRHCLKQAGDYDRNFTQEADNTITKMIMDNPIPPKNNVWNAKIICGTGIIIPQRFTGENVHILVYGNEFRLKIGKTILQTTINNIDGNFTQERRVSRFKKMASVYLPKNIIRQLPANINLQIITATN